MHNLPWYPINTSYLSAQSSSSYHCYFPMPFTHSALRGFVDFNHVFRPHVPGTPTTAQPAAAVARCILKTKNATQASIRLAWDDHMILRINDAACIDLGHHQTFRPRTVPVDLNQGSNIIVLKLSNTLGSNNAGWAFAFHATFPDGTTLRPQTSFSTG